MRIRAFAAADYPAYLRVRNATRASGFPSATLAEVRHNDANRDARFQRARFVVEVAGQVVAYADAVEPQEYYKPGRWWLDIRVDPDHQGRGVGRALADRLRQFLEDKPTDALWAGAQEGSRGVMFASHFGFVTTVREAFSRLDVSHFEAAPFAALRARVEGGLAIRTGRELLATVPDAKRRWWDLDWAIEQDVPATGAPTRIDFDVFCRYFEAPWFDPDAWIFALDGEHWVGLSALKPTADADLWWTAVTGVVRSHRRRGLATVLKLHAIDFVRSRGARWIRTDNEENNPMLTINRRLGFVEDGAWLDLELCHADP